MCKGKTWLVVEAGAYPGFLPPVRPQENMVGLRRALKISHHSDPALGLEAACGGGWALKAAYQLLAGFLRMEKPTGSL